jgi:hypothetical protein
VGEWVTRTAVLAALAACGSGGADAGRSPVERAIDEALGARFGVAVTTRCFHFAPACEAKLQDGTSLPISVVRRGTETEWRVIGLVVTSDPLEAYLRDSVADLGAPQTVRCAPRVRRIRAGERIECWLERGGKGFVTVFGDGRVSLEVELHAPAANARSELVTPARDQELLRRSKMLDSAEETGEEPVAPPDAGELQVPPTAR